ncbi:MAG: glycosyltransferase family 4 protein [bacterium]|nr:glycosyltransferase family 4 protein [bacterium]
MKKVLIFTTAYKPYVGGAEIAVAEITKRLGADHIFFMITYRFSRALPAFENRDGMEIYRLGFGTVLDRWFLFPILAFFQALRIHRRQKVDLLWAVMVTYASIGAYFMKIVHPKLPLLLTLQEGDPIEHLRFGKMGMLGLWWKLLLGRADYVQAISSYLADFAVSRGARAKVAIVPNGVNIEHFSKTTDSGVLQRLKDSFRLRPEDKVAITVSRLVRKNAVDVCVRSLSHLDGRFKLLIVGTGQDMGELQKLVSELKLSERVIFTGQISHVELPDYLHLASVFIRPSRSEGLGNSFLEAMAANVPIIGTLEGGVKDFLKDGETGLACKVDDPKDLAEKIQRISEDQVLREAVSFKAAQLIRHSYSWDSVTQGMENIFGELVKKD